MYIHILVFSLNVCVCVCACVHACMHACVRVWVCIICSLLSVCGYFLLNSDKTEADSEREKSLLDQWVGLTEERNAVLVPQAGSGIPGAPADWLVLIWLEGGGYIQPPSVGQSRKVIY